MSIKQKSFASLRVLISTKICTNFHMVKTMLSSYTHRLFQVVFRALGTLCEADTGKPVLSNYVLTSQDTGN